MELRYLAGEVRHNELRLVSGQPLPSFTWHLVYRHSSFAFPLVYSTLLNIQKQGQL